MHLLINNLQSSIRDHRACGRVWPRPYGVRWPVPAQKLYAASRWGMRRQYSAAGLSSSARARLLRMARLHWPVKPIRVAAA